MTDIKLARRTLLLGGLATGVSACSPFFGGGLPHGDVEAEAMTAIFLPWVNDLRKGRGLPALARSRACELAAMDQASRMALAGKMNHITGGESVLARFKRMGLPLPASENIAMHQSTPERAFQAWVHSPGHLKNMVGNYSHIGVARAVSPNSGNTPFWAMCLSQ